MVKRPHRLLAALGMVLILWACGPTLGETELVPPTADVDDELSRARIEVAGKSRWIHLETWGDTGPVILFLHGSLSDSRAWRPYRTLARDGFRVVLWDQRGNGLSERISPAEYDLQSVMDEIDAVRSLVAPDRPVYLVGHSFGAMFAAAYAARNPDDVAGAILIEPAGLNAEIFEATFDSVFSIRLFAPVLNQMFWQNEFLAPTSHEVIDYRALMMLLDGEQTDYFCDRDDLPDWPVWRPGALVDSVRAERVLGYDAAKKTFDYDFSEGLADYPGRVVLVGGTCSALGADFQRRYHEDLFPSVRVVEIAGVGHRLLAENPAAVLKIIRDEWAGRL